MSHADTPPNPSLPAEADSAWHPESVEHDIPGVPAELAGYRATIDNLDAALVHLLAERFRCTQNVGALKARLNLPPSDPQREARQVARLRALAADSGLDPTFAEKFFSFIVAEVIRHHEEIRDNTPPADDASRPGADAPSH